MIKIKPEDVAIGIAVSNWEEAIKESSKILLERGQFNRVISLP